MDDTNELTQQANPEGSTDAADPQTQDSGDTGENTICLGDNTLMDKKDGDQVEFTATGTLSIDGDKRYVSVDQVDGDPVKAESASEEAAPSDSLDAARDALKSNIAQQGGYNNSQA